MNKKAAEMTIGTIVIIVLALVVLVVLIYGFSTGWGNLWENILGFGGGKVNVQTIVQSCQLSCTTSAEYDYCTKKKTVIFDEDKNNPRNKKSFTCSQLENEGVGLYCDNVACPDVETGGCTNWGGRWVESSNDCEENEGSLTFDARSCCTTKRTCSRWDGKWIAKGNTCPEGEAVFQSIITNEDKSAHPTEDCCIPTSR